MELAVILLRLMQYAAGFVLLGAPLFALYALPPSGEQAAASLGWPRRLLVWSAAILLLSSLAGLLTQTAVVAGSMAEALKPDSLVAVITSMAMGPSSLVRATAAILALVALLTLRPGLRLWILLVPLGVVASASFAWMGHGAATEGPGGIVHLAADITHLLAAAVWFGALVFFAGLAFSGDALSPTSHEALHRALHGFAGVGSAVVAALLASGLINSGFLIGPTGVPRLGGSLYGQLLVVKLLFFVVMLGLAAANRLRHTPRLARASLEDRPRALSALKISLMVEAGAALIILGLVAWLGRLAPISSP